MERFQKYFSSSVPLCYIGAFGALLGIKPELDLTFMSHIPNQTLFWPFTFTLGLKGMVKGIALDTYLVVRYVPHTVGLNQVIKVADFTIP